MSCNKNEVINFFTDKFAVFSRSKERFFAALACDDSCTNVKLENLNWNNVQRAIPIEPFAGKNTNRFKGVLPANG